LDQRRSTPRQSDDEDWPSRGINSCALRGANASVLPHQRIQNGQITSNVISVGGPMAAGARAQTRKGTSMLTQIIQLPRQCKMKSDRTRTTIESAQNRLELDDMITLAALFPQP